MLVSPVKGKHSHPTPTERDPMTLKTTLRLIGSGLVFALLFFGIHGLRTGTFNVHNAFIAAAAAGLWTILMGIWISAKNRRQGKSS